MGADVADINNDGRMDYGDRNVRFEPFPPDDDQRRRREGALVFDRRRSAAVQRNAVFLNTGTGHLMEVAH